MSKIILAGAAALLLTAGAANAQAPATTTSQTTTTTTTAPATGMSLDTPIEQIVANPAGKAVLDKDLPGLTTHPAYDQFKSMSLKEVEPMSQGAITDAMLAKTGTDLAALPK
jgi:hypothetical protein